MNRNSRNQVNGARSLALVGLLGVALAACGTKASCDAPEATDKMLKLASRAVITDLSAQCAASLYKKIPAVAPSCPVDAKNSASGCIAACKAWAASAVESSVSDVQTTFRDETIATVNCRASVRFNVAYDGGQAVVAKIAYLVAPRNGDLQVVLGQ